MSTVTQRLRDELVDVQIENDELLKCLKDIIGACDRSGQKDDLSLIDEFTDEMEQAARQAIARAEARRLPVQVEKLPKTPRTMLDGTPFVPEPKCKHCGKPRGSHLAKTHNCPSGGTRGFPSYGQQVFEAKEPGRRKKIS